MLMSEAVHHLFGQLVASARQHILGLYVDTESFQPSLKVNSNSPSEQSIGGLKSAIQALLRHGDKARCSEGGDDNTCSIGMCLQSDCALQPYAEDVRHSEDGAK